VRPPLTLAGVCLDAVSHELERQHQEALRRSLRSPHAEAASGGEPTLLVRFDNPNRIALRPEWAAGAGRFFFTLTEHESDIWVMELESEN